MHIGHVFKGILSNNREVETKWGNSQHARTENGILGDLSGQEVSDLWESKKEISIYTSLGNFTSKEY